MAKEKPTQHRLSAHWKSRILGHEKIDPRRIKPNPQNWRQHPTMQQDAMRDALDQVGVIQGIIVNKRTGHIVDGHMRHQLALDNGETVIDVIYVDLSKEEERLALATVNPMGELAVTDPEKLSALILGIARTEGPLDGVLRDLEQLAAGAIVKQTDTGSSKGRTGMQPSAVMRMMLENPDVAIVERALATTGEMNRGRALLAICHAYLGNIDADRQHDTEPQNGLASQLAQALAPLTGGHGNPRRQRPRVRKDLPGAAPGDRVRDGSDKSGGAVSPAADVVGVPGESRTGP